MSALATSRIPSLRLYTELAATQEISHIASLAARYDTGIEATFSIVLGISGVRRVTMEPFPEFTGSLSFDEVGRPSTGVLGSAIASIEIGGHSWGRLRTHFELASDFGANPVRFTRYIAQQIAGMLERLFLRDQRDRLHRQIAALQRRLETRKAIARASGLIARRDGISLNAAVAEIAAIARRHRRTLLLTSQSIVFLEGDGGSLQSPIFRRLLPTEATGPVLYEANHPLARARRG